MPNSRITITRRHTGRYYIGLDPEAFCALFGQIKLAEGMSKMILLLDIKPHDPVSTARVRAAFNSYAAKVKSAASDPPAS